MNIKNNTVRVRFAPSPTGHLHIGGLRTALFNWLFARHHGGAFLLRIEDTDFERSTQEYRDSILHSFAWTQLEHDEEIITQSERFDEYHKIAQQLIDAKKAYRCFCSPEDLTARYEKETSGDFFVTYDGYCRNRAPQPGDENKQHVVRFKLPENCTEVTFEDLIKGPITINLEQLDDFIIVRSGGFPMYNFAVVVDDAFMRITHIIRGEEHIVNTPKQILLNDACGYPNPRFAHLPLILGTSGNRLSKRDAATSVLEYKGMGYLPEALINYLARLGWSHGDQEIFSREELIKYFSLDAVGKKGAVFDPEKLAWLNGMYLRETDNKRIMQILLHDVSPDFMQLVPNWDIQKVTELISLYKDRVSTIAQLSYELKNLYVQPTSYEQADVEKYTQVETVKYLDVIIHKLEELSVFSVDLVKRAIKETVAELGIKMVQLGQPIRIALIGKSSGPGFVALLVALGKEESLKRIRAFMQQLK